MYCREVRIRLVLRCRLGLVRQSLVVKLLPEATVKVRGPLCTTPSSPILLRASDVSETRLRGAFGWP